MLQIFLTTTISTTGFLLSSSPALAQETSHSSSDFPVNTQQVAQNAELTDNLNNSDWQAVGSNYIDVANIQRNGNLVIFDALYEFELTYVREEANCDNNQVRTLRIGYFTSPTSVVYKDATQITNYGEFKDPKSFQQELLNFACRANVEETVMPFSAFTVSTAIPLQSGIYANRDQGPFITVVQQGDRTCYASQRYNVGVYREFVYSATQLPGTPHVYQLDQADSFLQQANSNTLLIGDSAGSSTVSRWNDLSEQKLDNIPAIKECLRTTGVYYNEREEGF